MMQNGGKRNISLLLIFWRVLVLVVAEKVQQGVIRIVSKGWATFRCFRLSSAAVSMGGLLANVSIWFSLSWVCYASGPNGVFNTQRWLQSIALARPSSVE